MRNLRHLLSEWGPVISIWLVCFYIFLIPACRSKKDISNSSEFKQTIDITDSTVRKFERINQDWIRINESLYRRDGLLSIDFDSLTSVSVTRDHTIQAIGYNPRISSSSAETSNLNIRDSVNQSQTTALEIEGSKKKLDLGSTENSKKNIDRIPSFTPWIGAGLAVAIVVLAVLWYFFRKT